MNHILDGCKIECETQRIRQTKADRLKELEIDKYQATTNHLADETVFFYRNLNRKKTNYN